MRHTFEFFNGYNKQSIEIGIYFENNYSQEDLDKFRADLEVKLEDRGWFTTNKVFNSFGSGYVKACITRHVEYVKKRSMME